MGRLEVRQQTNGLQYGLTEILRLVDYEDKAPALEHLVKQDLIQCLVHSDDIHPSMFNTQFTEKIAEELTRIALGLEQEHDARRIAQIFHQFVQQYRLTQTRSGDQGHESPNVLDALRQRC